MSGALLELYRHKTWATLRLLAYCQGLEDRHLEATIPGTFGTIRETLRHLVDAEEDYFEDLTGERAGPPLPEGPVPLEELAERIRRMGPRWEDLAQDTELQAREITSSDDRFRLSAAVPMAQALHHANEHRAQVQSILGALGLDDPRLSVWSHARASGLMQELRPGAR